MEIRDKVAQTQVRETGSKVTSQITKPPKTKKTREKTPKEKTRLSGESRRSEKIAKPSNLKELQKLVAQEMTEIGGDGLSPQQLQEKKEALVSMGVLQDMVNPNMVTGHTKLWELEGVQAFLPFASARERGEQSISGKIMPNRETQISFREAFDLIEAGQTVNFKPYTWEKPQYECDTVLNPDKSSHRYEIKIHDFNGLNKLAQETMEANPKVEIHPGAEENLSGREIFNRMQEKAEKLPKNAMIYYPLAKNRLGKLSKISYNQAALRLKAGKPVTFQPMFDRYPGGMLEVRKGPYGGIPVKKEELTDPAGTMKRDLLPTYQGTKIKGTQVSSFDELKEMRSIDNNYLRLKDDFYDFLHRHDKKSDGASQTGRTRHSSEIHHSGDDNAANNATMMMNMGAAMTNNFNGGMQ